jgi:hypothetical protein
MSSLDRLETLTNGGDALLQVRHRSRLKAVATRMPLMAFRLLLCLAGSAGNAASCMDCPDRAVDSRRPE